MVGRHIRRYLLLAALTMLLLLMWNLSLQPTEDLGVSIVSGTLSQFVPGLTSDNVANMNRTAELEFPEELPAISAVSVLYQDYMPGESRHVTLTDDKFTQYFSYHTKCLIEGTSNMAPSTCVCKEGWHGASCSIPDFVDETKFNKNTKLRVREGAPRRLLYGMTFNMEFEMLELRLGEAGDLIDVLLIVESNYSGIGEPKPLFLLQKLRNGYLRKYQHKIVHLLVDYFPTSNNPKDGEYTDFFLKNYASVKGLEFVHGRKKDDIFIYADADELHRREALLFLKLHDGYPEPVGVYLRRNVFGFFWSSGYSFLGIACSVEMLQVVYQNKCSEIRGATSMQHKYVTQLEAYRKSGQNVKMWQMGDISAPSRIAGWHCSWCFDVGRVRTKLLSAFNYDFPRWGDYPQKTKSEYIKKLIKTGLWFDNKSTYLPQYIDMHAPYAPTYALKHFERYIQLLLNPYHSL